MFVLKRRKLIWTRSPAWRPKAAQIVDAIREVLMDTTVVDATDLDAAEIVAFVRTVPIFHTLSKDQLRQIAEAADVNP